MGRVSTGAYDFTCRRGVHGIRWRETSGKRTEVSLGTKDIDEARRLAPIVYAERVGGSKKEGGSNFRVSQSTKIKDLLAEWIAKIAGSEASLKTCDTYVTYGKHWLKHMKVLGDLREKTLDDYKSARLKVVIADTVRLELSALRRFCRWLKAQERIFELPEFPEIGDKVTGTRYKIRRRRKPTIVFSPEQMEKTIAKLPEWSERKVKGKHFPVRGFFEVCRWTGLRPTTVEQLRGRDVIVSGLHIRPEADKNRWERVVPLVPQARKALDDAMPENLDDLIFGDHEWDRLFERAVFEALGADMADRMTTYDLKHGLVTQLFDRGASETGIQFLTGTTAAIRVYSHPTRSAAEEAIGGLSGDTGPGGHRGTHKTSRSVSSTGKPYVKQKSENTGLFQGATRKKTRV
jgi:integrase